MDNLTIFFVVPEKEIFLFPTYCIVCYNVLRKDVSIMKLPNFNPYLGKDTQPVGLARYLDTFFVHIGQLMVCNLLFLLCSIPLITIGPGLIALSRISCTILRGQSVSAVQDFFDAFRKNFKAGLVISFTLVPLYLWQFYISSAHLQNYFETGSGLPLFLLFFVGFIVLNCFSLYLFPLLAYLNADGWTVLQNALLLCFVGGGYTFFGGLSSTVLFTVAILSLPNSLPLWITILFSFLIYNTCFFGWKIVDKHVFSPYYEAHPEESFRDNY